MIVFFYKIRRGLISVSTTILNRIQLRLNNATIGNSFYTCGMLLVRNFGGHKAICIGNNVTMNSCRLANPIGGDTKTILYTCEKGKIIIHDNVKLSNVTFFSRGKIEIGSDTFIGGGTRIYDTDFHSVFPRYRINCMDIEHIPVKEVVVGKRVFIGSNVLILKGVHIGDESVIGAGSVVTKNVPQGEIWAGNPAKFIKKLY